MNHFSLELPENATLSQNTDTKFIIITEDKLKNIFYEYLSSFASRDSWKAPATLFVSVGVTFVTTDFVEFLKISPDVWKLAYVCVLIGSLAFTVKNGIKAYRKRNEQSITFLVGKISEQSIE